MLFFRAEARNATVLLNQLCELAKEVVVKAIVTLRSDRLLSRCLLYSVAATRHGKIPNGRGLPKMSKEDSRGDVDNSPK